MVTRKIEVRKATLFDLDRIKFIADLERDTIGFMTKATYMKAIEMGNILVVIVDGLTVGFQSYYHRKKDLQTTLYQKAIIKEYRFEGLGKLLVDTVIEEAKSIGHQKLLLKCPVDLPSNLFHERIGFTLVRQELGKKRKLNVWEMTISGVANANR